MKTFLGLDAPLPDTDNPANAIDLVVHLGRTRRFGGWGDDKWTVLHHSMLTTLLWLRAFGTEGAHHALLHDGHEYITGDIPSPVKAHLGRDNVTTLESEIDQRIAALLKTRKPSPEHAARVKLVDQAALIIEAFYFGTKGSFDFIGEANWGASIGKTEGDRVAIRAIIQYLCPEIVQAMGHLRPAPGLNGQYVAVYK